MANVRHKPPELLQNARGGRVRSLTVVSQDGRRVPACPKGVAPLTRKVWRSFWSSRPAQAVEECDYEQLRWWILCVDERERLREMVTASPLVKGSTGTLMLNPLARRVRELTAVIDRTADQFGMTPYSRFKLNLTYAEAHLKLDDLRRQLGQSSETRPQPRTVNLADFDD